MYAFFMLNIYFFKLLSWKSKGLFKVLCNAILTPSWWFESYITPFFNANHNGSLFWGRERECLSKLSLKSDIEATFIYCMQQLSLVEQKLFSPLLYCYSLSQTIILITHTFIHSTVFWCEKRCLQPIRDILPCHDLIYLNNCEL